MRASSLSLLLALLTVLSACAGPDATPEQQIRAVLGEIERASRAGEVGVLKDFISEHYRDRQGRTRQDLHSVIRYQYLRHKSVYLLTRIEDLELQPPVRARLVVLGAMASAPILDPGALRAARADVYRFDLELADEGGGEWRVVSAAWRPAGIDDFL